MGGNPESGELRELQSVGDLRKGEVLFKLNELVAVKGMIFKIVAINPLPENTMLLKGIARAEEANMI